MLSMTLLRADYASQSGGRLVKQKPSRKDGIAEIKHLLVGDVDGHIGLLCVVVGQQTDVGQSPAKDIGDDEDSGILVVAGDVGWVVSELGLLADGLAVPLESLFAASRHDVRVVCGDVCVGWGKLRR